MEKNHAKDQARAQYASIVEMVAALNVDYDRLDELKSELADLTDAIKTAEEDLEAHPGDASFEDEIAIARDGLKEWNEDNAQELADLKEAAGDCEDSDEAHERITEDALTVEVRNHWHTPGADDTKPTDFRILLCTGGPAVQIRGEINEYGEPERAWLEYQDWGTQWARYFDASQDTLLSYARCFYFGE